MKMDNRDNPFCITKQYPTTLAQRNAQTLEFSESFLPSSVYNICLKIDFERIASVTAEAPFLILGNFPWVSFFAIIYIMKISREPWTHFVFDCLWLQYSQAPKKTFKKPALTDKPNEMMSFNPSDQEVTEALKNKWDCSMKDTDFFFSWTNVAIMMVSILLCKWLCLPSKCYKT